MQNITEKACNKCGVVKPLSEFGNCPARPDGKRYRCLDCTRSYDNEYRRKNLKKARKQSRARRLVNRDREAAVKREWKRKNKDKVSKANRAYRERNREKCKAWNTFWTAVESGSVHMPDVCECGNQQPLHAHHDDYSKPLDVRWLCVACHARVHVELRGAVLP